MSITAATVTTDTITTTAEPIDCLLDAMITAQNTLGQISWDTITTEAAHGTYRDPAGTTAQVTVIDTGSTGLLGAVQDWMATN
jgi:hypothetical protein